MRPTLTRLLRRWALLESGAGRVAAAGLVLLALGTAVAMAVLWPSTRSFGTNNVQRTVEAEVTSVNSEICEATKDEICRQVKIKVLDGANRGSTGGFVTGEGGFAPDVDVGDRVRVLATGSGPQDPASNNPAQFDNSYAFVDFDRSSPLLWLLALFVAVALAVSRFRAARSLVGLGISLAIVVGFVIPALLDGGPPVAVATVGAFAVMLVTMVLAHGVGLKSAAAALGTTVALVLTVLLGVLFTHLAHLTGFTSDASAVLYAKTHVSLHGLIVAGIVIGALGVLDDLTVTQASTVLALRRANPRQKARELYRHAIDVGHDHIAATINTLVLAYVGASLPLLLAFSIGKLPFSYAVNREDIAEQIVATLVGSIGLISAVPLTTAIAAILAARTPVDSIPREGHGHSH